MLEWAPTVMRVAKATAWASLCAIAVPLATAIFPEKRSFPARQPLFFCAAVLGLVAALLVGLYNPMSDTACEAQAILITYFGNATVLWWLVISHTAYSMVARELSPLAVQDGQERASLVFAWGVPLLLAACARLTGALDTTRSARRWECWITELHSRDQWIYLYGEMGAALLAGLLYFWPRVARRVWHAGGMHVRHLIFIAIFSAVFAVDFTYRLQDDYGDVSYNLTIARTVTTCGVGVWVFPIFGLTRRNYELWAGLFLDGSLHGGRYGRGGKGRRGRGGGGAGATPARASHTDGSPLLHQPTSSHSPVRYDR